ncbi:hypothetical protein [Candidatus Halobonum tyrrellensis]|uniref:hypothetical protein n=1 Tax=Candidatus Halobonum tyrrellensis TaxID=1431545 RepID=UPI001F2654B0|nr:hypothetical protein [Candidatus Halobonum tyrrellensis]
MHFGTRDGETIVRYDNSQGVHERHSIGDADPEHIEFPGPTNYSRASNATYASICRPRRPSGSPHRGNPCPEDHNDR